MNKDERHSAPPSFLFGFARTLWHNRAKASGIRRYRNKQKEKLNELEAQHGTVTETQSGEQTEGIAHEPPPAAKHAHVAFLLHKLNVTCPFLYFMAVSKARSELRLGLLHRVWAHSVLRHHRATDVETQLSASELLGYTRNKLPDLPLIKVHQHAFGNDNEVAAGVTFAQFIHPIFF